MENAKANDLLLSRKEIKFRIAWVLHWILLYENKYGLLKTLQIKVRSCTAKQIHNSKTIL